MMHSARFPTRVATFLTGIIVGALATLATPQAAAQHPSALSARDKTGIFIQRLIKVSKLKPERFQPLILEYEIGAALEELGQLAADGGDAHAGHGHAGHGHDDGALHAAGACSTGCDHAGERDFIAAALEDLYPKFQAAAKLAADGADAEARQAFEALLPQRRGPDLSDPYKNAYARYRALELQFAALLQKQESGQLDADGLKKAITEIAERCDDILLNDRLYLIPDHRVCEIVAQCFALLGKPVLESTQYALLLTDFPNVPPEMSAAAKTRLGELQNKAGRPLNKVAGWMQDVEALLEEEKTGDEPTQQKETEILVTLDKLIELQEARERKT